MQFKFTAPFSKKQQPHDVTWYTIYDKVQKKDEEQQLLDYYELTQQIHNKSISKRVFYLVKN